MSISINDSNLIIGTAPKVAPRNYIQFLLPDENGNAPFILAEGQGLKIYKTVSPDPDILLIDGTVPVLSPSDPEYPDGRQWIVQVQVTIQQIPPVEVAPTIDLVSPDEVSASDLIVIQGNNFSSNILDNIVTIDGETVEVLSANTFQLECQCPSTIVADAHLPVIVTVNGLSSETYPTNEDAQIEIVAPSIISISPTSGRVSAQITINGAEFSIEPSDILVTFNGSIIPAELISVDKEIIIVEVPKDATNGTIEVAIGVNSATSSTSFTRNNHTVTGPGTEARGNPITITGTNFSDHIADHVVTINGASATITASTATTLDTTVPMGASNSGNISVDIGGVIATFPFTAT